jgi:DNA-binding HxlR family transcriptional regulator
MRAMASDIDNLAFCPYYHHAVELIGRRWTGAILRALLAGMDRFSEVTATVPGLSDRMLSERLKELEAEGIVDRLVTAEKPVRVEYLLTDKGRALGAVIEAVSGWAETWAGADSVHEPGGGAVLAVSQARGG